MKIPNIDWNAAITLITIVASALGAGHLRQKARDWAKEVRGKAIALAHEVVGQLRHSSLEADRAYRVWERRFEEWVYERAKKLPAALKSQAVDAAHRVFNEVHAHLDPLDQSLKKLEQAAANFERALIEMQSSGKLPPSTRTKPPLPAGG